MTKYPYLFLVGGVFSLMIAMGIGRFAYTPILPLMQHSLDFSDAVAGYLASSNYAGYLVGALLTGILPLRKHRTVYLRISLIASILTTCLMGVTNAYILMLGIRFLSGVASAFISVVASTIVLEKLAEKGKTNWSGLFYAGVGLGIFLSTLFIPFFDHLFNWQGVWIGLACIGGLLGIFVWTLLKEAPSKTRKKDTVEPNLGVPPSRWLPWLIVAYGLEGLGYIVTGTFIVAIANNTPTFYIEPSIVWIVVGLGAIPSCVLWSTLAKKWGYVKSLVLAMSLQSIGIGLPVFWLTQNSLIVSAFLFGATFMGITTIATSLARQMNPENSAKIIGYLTAIYAIGQMIGPTIAGILSSTTESYQFALLGAASVVLLGAVLLISGIRYDSVPKIQSSFQK